MCETQANFCYLKVFSILISILSGLHWDPLTYSRFKNKTVLLIFRLWQLRDAEYTEIFEITQYRCYFANNTSWQYSSPRINLLSRSSQMKVSCGIKSDRMFEWCG